MDDYTLFSALAIALIVGAVIVHLAYHRHD